jgi:hypothetical protein
MARGTPETSCIHEAVPNRNILFDLHTYADMSTRLVPHITPCAMSTEHQPELNKMSITKYLMDCATEVAKCTDGKEEENTMLKYRWANLQTWAAAAPDV